MIYCKASEIDFALSDLPHMSTPGRVLLTSPTYFQVEYVINPHMKGHLGGVDPARARAQWTALKDTYQSLGVEPAVVDGRTGLPDMVFCANQTLPIPASGSEPAKVILSRMYSEHRAKEVSAFDEYFSSIGYQPVSLRVDGGSFEGMGDAIWHPGRRLLWGGFGFRTAPEVYDRLSEALSLPIMVVQLDDPDFYHLDTCLSVLSEKAALIYPGAFDADGLSMINALFETVIEAPEAESRGLFACNAHCPDGQNVIIQRGCTQTNQALRQAGFTPVEVDTDEFLKAGGSVFCMKQMYW